MGKFEKIFVLIGMIIGNILFPQIVTIPSWVQYEDKFYFSLVSSDIDENTNKKRFNVAYGHYNMRSDNEPTLLIGTSAQSERMAFIKMNALLMKRGDIMVNKQFI